MHLSSFSSNSSSQLDILWHNGDPLSVDSAQVGVFKKTNQVGLTGLLKSSNSRALEAQIGLEVLGDLTNQTLERQLADKKLGALLVATNLTKGNCTRAISVRLLDSSCGWSTLSSCFGG